MPVQDSLIFKPQACLSTEAFPYELRVMSRPEDRAGLLRLRLAALRSDGRVDQNDVSVVNDAVDDAAQTVHVAAVTGGATAGALRMTFKSWTDQVTVLPCAAYFPAIRSAGLRKLSIAEMSHLVVDPALAESAGAVLHAALLRAALIAAQAARIAMLVTAAVPERAAFYGELLRFHPIGAPAVYPPGSMALTLTGGSMVGTASGRGIERHAFFKTSEEEIASMRTQLFRCLSTSPRADRLPASAEGPRA